MSGVAIPVPDSQHTIIRPFRPGDFEAIGRIVSENQALDRHTSYTYWANCRVFGPLFLVLEIAGQVAGFAMGIGPNSAGEGLFWQIGVRESHRHQGHGRELAMALLAAFGQHGIRQVLVTISQENLASLSLFEACASAWNTQLVAIGPVPRMADDIQAETLYGFSLAPESR